MKIEENSATARNMQQVGNLEPGTCVINGPGNLCMVCRDRDPELVPERPKAFSVPVRLRRNPNPRKVRIVRLSDGASYKVLMTCVYEVVDAKVVWGRKAAA